MLPVLHNLLAHVDEVLLGGHMAHAFLSAGTRAVASRSSLSSIHSPQKVLAVKLQHFCQERNIAVTLPKDVYLNTPEAKTPICMQVDPQAATQPFAVDIGPQTQQLFASKLQQAGTAVVMNCVGQPQQSQHSSGMAALFSSMMQGPKLRIVAGHHAVQAYYQHPHSGSKWHCSAAHCESDPERRRYKNRGG